MLLVIPDENRGRKHRNTCAHGAAVFHAQQRAPIERGCIRARPLAREPVFEGFNSVADQLADILEVLEKIVLPQISSDSKTRQLDARCVDT
ncbi:hypothetical protein [Bradyrhizobium neotropicale]|uniref:hypothetical protein n=1 Tax=Bradyrhizobium neotropicale TaxID=1497615 RepID=UPI001AD7658E|nr:hypothetical protein [Bradyrhizobium neotropicale]MBO4226330.1 hypothetical protein [Bradyrhizobium neotropicale]